MDHGSWQVKCVITNRYHTFVLFYFTLYILHFTFSILHFAFCILHFAFCLLHFVWLIVKVLFIIIRLTRVMEGWDGWEGWRGQLWLCNATASFKIQNSTLPALPVLPASASASTCLPSTCLRSLPS